MKSSRVIFGIIIILIGLALLLSNLGLFNINWNLIWRLWPVIFILWGLSLLLDQSRHAGLFTVLAFVLLALVLAAGAKSDWNNFGALFQTRETQSQTLTRSYNQEDKAELTLNSGAGTFNIKGTTDNLIEADILSSIGEYELQDSKNDTKTNLVIKPKGKNISAGFSKANNTVNIKLNPSPLWNINLQIGAASADLNLSDYGIDNAAINAGASSINLKLGKKNTKTNVVVKAGASSLDIAVPETSGVEIATSTGLSSKSFSGFSKVEDNKYRTANFDAAINKIFINLETGVSSINIATY